MAVTVGFEQFPKDWEGPVVLRFQFYTDHTDTARYRSRVGDRWFDLYAPRFMLRVGPHEKPPEVLLVAIGKTTRPAEALGFGSARKEPAVDDDLAEFSLSETAYVNSIEYSLRHDGRLYRIYVPKAIFGAEPPPQRLFLHTALPQ